MNDAAPALNVRSKSLPAGTLIGDRFSVQQLAANDDGCDSYWAIDAQTSGTVLLRLVAPPPSLRPVLESDLRQALTLSHGNLVPVVAAGVWGERVYVAAAFEDGHTLRQLVDAQRSQGRAVGAPSAHTIIGHIAAGIVEGLQGGAHGAIHPESVWIARAGRIRLGDVGLARALPTLARRGGPAGAPGGLYLAPELAQGGSPTAASDVYSVGAILYELLTAAAPLPPLRAPSQVAAGISPALDAVVARALAGRPADRFASVAELVSALGHALGAVASAGGASGTDPARPTIGKSFNVADAAGLSGEAERWLVQKDKLDFGPFSLQHVKAQLEQGVFGPENLIVDMDSGARLKIKDHPELGEFAVKATRKLEQVRRAQADHATEHVERKKSRATVLILGSALLGVGALVTVFLINRKDAEKRKLESRASEADVDAFIKNVKLSVGQSKRPTARRAAGSGSRGDEFSNDLNLGDVSKDGGDQILSDDAINKVMMARYRSLVPCLMDERRRNPGVSGMDLEFVVRGSGKVSAVRVNGEGRGPFASCVLSRMQSFGFPTYNGAKTIASWSMNLK